MRRRKWIGRLLVGGVLGLLTTVMITGIGLLPGGLTRYSGPDACPVRGSVADANGLRQFWAVVEIDSFARRATKIQLSSGFVRGDKKLALSPSYARCGNGDFEPRAILAELPVDPPANTDEGVFVTAGWPLQWLEGSSIRNRNDKLTRESLLTVTNDEVLGIPLPRLDELPLGSGRLGYDREIPTGIKPLGLAGNTLLGAAAWSLPLIGVGWARAMWRRRKGLCAECGYDLHGQVSPGCPECGSGREVAEPAAGGAG